MLAIRVSPLFSIRGVITLTVIQQKHIGYYFLRDASSRY
jgi:hypothetical protein